MRVASFLNCLNDTKSPQKCFLFFGNQEDLIAVRQRFLKQALAKKCGKTLVNHSLEDLTTLQQAQTPSLFGKQEQGIKLYSYTSTSAKAFEQLLSLLPQLNGYFMWQAGAIASKSSLVLAAEKHSDVWVVPSYQPERGELEFYIRSTLENENICFENTVLQFLIHFHQDELAALQSNLDVIVLYALKEKTLSLEQAQFLCQSFEAEDLKACATAFIQGNSKKFLEQLHNLGSLSLMLIPFLRFTSKMLQTTFEGGFSGFQKNPAPSRSKNQIAHILQKFYQLERSIKTGESLPDALVEKTLLSLLR
jgi:DNA polymerase III delta subunit